MLNHIVLTTIYDPKVLHQYFKNIEENQHIETTKIWVIADKKTPQECQYTCNEISKAGLYTEFVSLERQLDWGGNYPDFYKSLPFNNDTRRNIGYAMALQAGCRVLISIDDDNFPTKDDFIGCHTNSIGSEVNDTLRSSNGFYNICEHIIFEPKRDIYPRGYPFKLRDEKNSVQTETQGNGIIGINAGLWLESPDIDATTWLNGSVKGVGYKGPDNFILDNTTWCPVNTQNTSIIRDLIPYYFCVPMGFEVPGGIIHRYGDIWGGYLALAVMEHTSYHVSFGRPIADHLRNPHDYLTDLRQEFWGILLTDWLVGELKGFEPDITDIHKRGDAILLHLREITAKKTPKWCPAEVRDFLTKVTDSYELYMNTCRENL